ncbi:MAG: TRAP transporter fused permease subunit [Clostridia bacterium]|nr:TRAP transporter fused permease subunit [Clostridia bacterium]
MSKKVRWYCTIALTVAFFVFQMYLALVKQLTVMLQTPLHMCFALSLVFLYNPIDKGYQKKLKKKAEENHTTVSDAELNKWAALRWIDLIFFAAIIFVVIYTVTNFGRLRDFDKVVSPVQTIDYVAMVCIIVLLLEAVRRTLGNILFFFIIAFIVYSWTAQYFPKGTVLYTKGKSFAKMLKTFCAGMILGESGVYGTPLTTSCTSLFYFIVFGAFFSECGGGQLLIDVGLKFSNKSSGGPAKAAVISSGLMGMVSGSAVANVATTGVMTIPMMKKIGYEPEEAGAIEAVASTGGQIMPPIMGVGAFIMAEMLGVNYLTVAADAIIPAFAYYFGVFVLVSLLAQKRASRSKQSEDAKIQVERPLLPRMYLLLPVVVLIVSIMRGFSLMRSGMYGIFVCLACNVVSFFLEKGPQNAASNIVNGIKGGNFAGLKQLWKSMLDGAKSAAEIAIPTAACGIIIDVMTEQTSLATNLSGVIAGLGMSNLFVALLIAMIGCMLLGMALPTVAAYLVGVTLFVPTLRSLGIQPLVANMFVFYYGIMAQITPPVCVASYTAAGIAGADAMKTGLRGMLFALVGFLCPFVFVYNPAILLQGTVIEIAIGAAQLLAGTYFLALSVSGFFKRELPVWNRLVFFVVALGFIDPNWVTTLIALAVGVALVFFNITAAKKSSAA